MDCDRATHEVQLIANVSQSNSIPTGFRSIMRTQNERNERKKYNQISLHTTHIIRQMASHIWMMATNRDEYINAQPLSVQNKQDVQILYRMAACFCGRK